MPPLLKPAYVPGVALVGSSCLPPPLTLTAAKKHDSPQAELKSSLRDPEQIRRFFAELSQAMGFLWKMQSYTRYSSRLGKAFAEKHHPHELWRLVYDANGRPQLPAREILAIREGGHGLDKASESARTVYEHAGTVARAYKDVVGFVIPQPMLMLVNVNTNEMTTGFNNAAFLSLVNFGLPMTIYGEGDGRFLRNLSLPLDVKLHEYGHSFLNASYPDKFPMQGMSGAINEHIADVLAFCLTARHNGWLGRYSAEQLRIGAEVMVTPGMALRSYLHPGTAFDIEGIGKDPQPDRMGDFKLTTQDMGGVHINSGILNRMFALFLLNTGESAWERPLKVWLKAVDTVKEKPNFLEFALQVKLAAREYGLEREFEDAARRVGVFDYVIYKDKIVPTRETRLV